MLSPFKRGRRGIYRIIMKGHIPYNKALKELSKKHRNDSTKAEIKLWMELRSSQMKGYKFNRQKPLLNYIVDFIAKV